MAWSTRYATARMERFFDQVDDALTRKAHDIYEEEAQDVADWWSGRITASGRAPGHGMENVRAAVTQPKRGGFFIRLGWLDSPPMAENGKTTWFVYQDVGYDPFGMIAKGYNAQRVPGLMLQMDARQRLTEGIYRANDRIAALISAAARQQRSG